MMMTEHFAEQVKVYRPLDELLPAQWHTGKVPAEDGTQIHYLRTGNGDKPAVVLLHGVQVDGMMWLRTAQALESDYDVIMPDFRMHGFTRSLHDGISAEMLVQDVIAVIEGLGLKNPVVIGHSMGADIAGRVAATYPLRGVVLVDPGLINFWANFPPMDGALPPYMQPIIETINSLSTLPHAERMVAGLTLLPPVTRPYSEVDYVTFVEGQSHFDAQFYLYMSKFGYLFEEPETIAQMNAPVLLLTAQPAMPNIDIKPGIMAFVDYWQRGEHVHFGDSGHAIMFDQFERFMEVIQRFLAEQG